LIGADEASPPVVPAVRGPLRLPMSGARVSLAAGGCGLRCGAARVVY
jgi:hypothetical protein